MPAGYLYVLVNPALSGMVKIGRTERSPAERATELSTATGVPTPFIVAFEQGFEDCHAAETYVHEVLSHQGHRTSSNREFFNITPTIAIAAILATPGRIDGPLPAATEEPTGVAAPFWRELVDEAQAHLYGLGDHLVDEKKAAQLFEKAIWPSPIRTDTFDRYDVPIGGIKWHAKDEYFQKSLSAKQSSW